MAMTEPAAVPRPPLVAGIWPRLADWLAGRSPGPDLLDWAIAVGCFIAFTVPVLPDAGSAHALGVDAAFGLLAAAPLVVRRRWPVLVLLVVAAVYAAAALAEVSFTPFISNAGPNLAIAVFTAADRSRPRWSLAAAAAAAVVTWALTLVAVHLHPQHGQDAVQLLAVVLAWPAGGAVRAIRGYRLELQLLERRRATEELRLARAEERLRLSREVHDVVSHSLSTIAVQAGVARLVLAQQPAQAGAALSAIETASRSALDELRALLRQLRDPQDAAEVATPTLADLPALIGKLRQAGLDVTHHSTGQPRPYRTAVEFSAYRIAQEALTNVTKHAHGARTRVEVAHGGDVLTITVTDDGGPTSVAPAAQGAGRGGMGIPGMRERAELLGGTLDAAPEPGGGFTVTARLPVGEGRPSGESETRGEAALGRQAYGDRGD
jgi:signal transduction histidine kinase